MEGGSRQENASNQEPRAVSILSETEKAPGLHSPMRNCAFGDARFEPGLTQVRQNHGPGRQQPAWMCRFRDVGARFSDVPWHIIVRADAYPGVTRMVVERHVRLNSPQCEPFQYEPHRH